MSGDAMELTPELLRGQLVALHWVLDNAYMPDISQSVVHDRILKLYMELKQLEQPPTDTEPHVR